MTCGPADGTIGGCLLDCGTDQARQQARRIGRAMVPDRAPGGRERVFRSAEPFAVPVSPMSDVTRILSAIEQGDPIASERLLPLVYDELRKLAAVKLAQEKPGQTLQATALVHEAYLRLVDVAKVQRWDSRGHFFAAAAEAMRRILLNRARDKKRAKRGGECHRVDLDHIEIALDTDDEELIAATDDMLIQLAGEDPEAARLVNLRFFAGLTLRDAAVALGLSQRTARSVSGLMLALVVICPSASGRRPNRRLSNSGDSLAGFAANGALSDGTGAGTVYERHKDRCQGDLSGSPGMPGAPHEPHFLLCSTPKHAGPTRHCVQKRVEEAAAGRSGCRAALLGGAEQGRHHTRPARCGPPRHDHRPGLQELLEQIGEGGLRAGVHGRAAAAECAARWRAQDPQARYGHRRQVIARFEAERAELLRRSWTIRTSPGFSMPVRRAQAGLTS